MCLVVANCYSMLVSHEIVSLLPRMLIVVCFYLFFRKQAFQSIINPDWNFSKLGIGGLDKEFSAIFRRAFASRVFPPEIVDQLGK